VEGLNGRLIFWRDPRDRNMRIYVDLGLLMSGQTYESWRISYQSSEQAARAAWAAWQAEKNKNQSACNHIWADIITHPKTAYCVNCGAKYIDQK
jgi:hypothetical protein